MAELHDRPSNPRNGVGGSRDEDDDDDDGGGGGQSSVRAAIASLMNI